VYFKINYLNTTDSVNTSTAESTADQLWSRAFKFLA